MAKEVIKPGLPRLTPEQVQNVDSICNRWGEDNILHYLETGELSFDDMPSLNPTIKATLEERLRDWINSPNPSNPKERDDWQRIEEYGDDFSSMSEERLAELKALLDEYIKNYSSEKPEGHHLKDASDRLLSIKRQQEKAEWDKVDKSDFNALKSYLESHPTSAFGYDAENMMWMLAKNNFPLLGTFIEIIRRIMPSNQSMMQYQSEIDNHLKIAEKLLEDYGDWDPTADPNDAIFKVKRRLDSLNANNPFRVEVARTLSDMKVRVIKDFKADLINADISFFKRLLDEKVFTKEEFISERIISENSFGNLYDDRRDRLEPIDQSESVYASPGKHTDVFLFGVPSTGKTCVLMGLTAQPLLFSYNTKVAGGNYGASLNTYLKFGKLPPSTSGNFVTLLSGNIPDESKSSVSHPVNIIDMAGETFLEKIADNSDKVSFEDMGIGATELLKNGNDKVFFIIVDPTVDSLWAKNGIASQSIVLKKMIDLFELPENKAVMEHVKAIHFVLTKADTLKKENREYVAGCHVREHYSDSLVSLKKICKESNLAINAATDFLPKLYTFSLGKFYLGGVFDYDPKDSAKLLKVIRNNTCGRREKTFGDKLKDVLNKTI